MKIQKTGFASYCINGIADGCKSCVKGRKLVLFISGLCSIGCNYCSLSAKRKDIDKTWANERVCEKAKGIKDAVAECRESNAVGAGITGGDPIIFIGKTLKYAKALKKYFGKRFHIHIYLPTRFVTSEKLKELSQYINEIRFHPEFLCRKQDKEEMNKSIENDINKIKLAGFFFKKKNIGIELPILPERKKHIQDFILKAENIIGFVNLNELEISDTNIDFITKRYKLKEGGYVVSGSKEAGLWILRQLKKKKTKLKVHLCTAELKNQYQYRNRLKMHKAMPYGKRTDDGTIIYLAIYSKNRKEFGRVKKEIKGRRFIDRKKKRIILSEGLAERLINKYKIKRVEEYPTFDADEIESEEITQK